MMKNRQDNNLIDRMGAVYAENYTELLGLLDQVRFMTQSRQDNDVTDLTIAVYTEKETELS